jgi:ribosomal-protein-alanine N-acetyltransferase
VPQASSTETPHLTANGLYLRTITEKDCDAFFEIFSDAQTLEYWSDGPIKKRDEAHELVRQEIKNARSENCINWGIALPDTDFLIGKFTLFNFHAQNRRAEVGYVLNRAHWGKGYMTCVMERVLEFAFTELSLHRLEADTDPHNEASLGLLQKFGFKREGYFRERWYVHEKWLDSVMLGLLKKEYEADRSRGTS